MAAQNTTVEQKLAGERKERPPNINKCFSARLCKQLRNGKIQQIDLCWRQCGIQQQDFVDPPGKVLS